MVMKGFKMYQDFLLSTNMNRAWFVKDSAKNNRPCAKCENTILKGEIRFGLCGAGYPIYICCKCAKKLAKFLTMIKKKKGS